MSRPLDPSAATLQRRLDEAQTTTRLFVTKNDEDDTAALATVLGTMLESKERQEVIIGYFATYGLMMAVRDYCLAEESGHFDPDEFCKE